MPTTKLEDLLKSGKPGNLDRLIRRAQHMDTLSTALKDGLAPELADNLIAANVRSDGELVVVCTSSAWASRLRFESAALLEGARTAGFEATTLRVKVTQTT